MERLPPLEKRIYDELLLRIKQGQYGWKNQIPSESELAKEFKVSRTTIRTALSMIASEGIVQRKHGSGTYINHGLLHLRLEMGEQWEFKDMIEKRGFVPDIKFIDSCTCLAGDEVASALQIAPNDSVLRIRKIFTADEVPAIYSLNFISLKVIDLPVDTEKIKGPISPFLEGVYGLLPSYSLTELYPISATPELAGILKIEPLTPLLLLEDIFYDFENKPMFYGYNYLTNLVHIKRITQN